MIIEDEEVLENIGLCLTMAVSDNVTGTICGERDLEQNEARKYFGFLKEEKKEERKQTNKKERKEEN